MRCGFFNVIILGLILIQAGCIGKTSSDQNETGNVADSFSFTELDNVSVDQDVSSSSVKISGFSGSLPITFSGNTDGAAYSIDGGTSWVSNLQNQTITPTDLFRVRQHSSSTYGAFTTLFVKIGNGTPVPFTVSTITNYLLLDNFKGSVGPLQGRQPDIGTSWQAILNAGVQMSAGGGAMWLTTANGVGAGYGESALSELPGEIGAKIKIYGQPWEGYTLGGTVNSNQYIVIIVEPSGSGSILLNYTVSAMAATPADVATGFAAYANSVFATYDAANPGNPTLITVTAVGSTIQFSSPLGVPHLNGVNLATGGNPVTMTMAFQISVSVATLASFPTGANFLNGMLHFIVAADGVFTWAYYIHGLVSFDQQKTRRQVGLVPDQEYLVKACIGAPGTPDAGWVWGVMYKDGVPINGGYFYTDPNDSKWSYYGKTVFFESGSNDQLQFTQAYVLRKPSLTRASVQAFVDN